MTRLGNRTIGPGLRAPAFLCFVVLLFPVSAAAQTAPAKPPAKPATTAPAAPAAALPVPSALGAVKLVTSAIIAVDQANKTGNYSVLLGLGSAGFQANNSSVSLGAAFGVFRQRQIDLADVIVLSPTYDIPPTLVKPDTVRIRGRFSLPRGLLAFDLLYKWDRGWRLDAIALAPPSEPAK
jgi:hypothetical protein